MPPSRSVRRSVASFSQPPTLDEYYHLGSKRPLLNQESFGSYLSPNQNKPQFFSPLSPNFKVPQELSKIVYQDPVERKKRERIERIAREREEMARLKDPFANMGQKPQSRAGPPLS